MKRRDVLMVGACALVLCAALLWRTAPAAREATRAAEPATQAMDNARLEHAAHTAHARDVSTTALVSTAKHDEHDRHPHPITEEHKRLYRDADLIDGAAARLRKGSVEDARALLAQHAREYGARDGSDNQGLGLLADCIEQRDAASVERARGFYDRHTHSMVRRQIRKQCLEEPR